MTLDMKSLEARVPVPKSSATLNVLAGVAASQAASALVLAVGSAGWAALTYLLSAFTAAACAIALGRAGSMLAQIDARILERRFAGGYRGDTLASLTSEIVAEIRPHLADLTVIAVSTATVSLLLLMGATVLARPQ